MDLKVVAIALAIAVAVSGAGVFISGNHDTAEPESKAAAYSGASLTNYNSNVADDPTEYSDISNIYKGISGNTMVFQIAELKNCIYTIVGYTGGDGYEKTLSFSDSKTIGSSFEKLTSKTFEYATSVKNSHSEGRSYSAGVEISGIIGWTESEGRFALKLCSSDCTVKSDGRYSDSGGLVGQDSVGKGVVSYCCFVQDRMFEYASGDHSPNDAVGYGNVAVSNIVSIMNSDAAKAFDQYYCIEYKQKHSCS